MICESLRRRAREGWKAFLDEMEVYILGWAELRGRGRKRVVWRSEGRKASRGVVCVEEVELVLRFLPVSFPCFLSQNLVFELFSSSNRISTPSSTPSSTQITQFCPKNLPNQS